MIRPLRAWSAIFAVIRKLKVAEIKCLSRGQECNANVCKVLIESLLLFSFNLLVWALRTAEVATCKKVGKQHHLHVNSEQQSTVGCFVDMVKISL